MSIPFDGRMKRTRSTPTTLRRRVAPAAALALGLLTGCAATGDDTTGVAAVETSSTADEPDDLDVASAAADSAATGDLGGVGTLDSSVVHEIAVSFDTADYDAMIEAYSSTGDKEWIVATVTIDGVTYDEVGLRLKGNSSLRGITGEGPVGTSNASADDPASLPWLVRLDKYVDDQNHEGLTDLVVRSNTSSTSLNEAVALELLELAGLASQDAIATTFSVNGGEPTLRLVIEHPDDEWMVESFDAGGALYKAESTGDYSYRGDDPESYDEVFDQEAGNDNADLTPLIDFLEFINDADDAAFDSELTKWLDVDAFATYLAMQELVDNFDDIDGPGNNSYLYYDTGTGRFTVVAWDHNLAFGLSPGGVGGEGGGPGGFPGGGFPPGELSDGEIPEGGFGDRPMPGDFDPGGFDPGVFEPGAAGPPDGGIGGPGLGSNVLVERFLANDAWQALVDDRLVELRTDLIESGVADSVLAEWSAIVASSGVVDGATVADEAGQIADELAGQLAGS